MISQSDLDLAVYSASLLTSCARRLPAFVARRKQWERGGLPANSVPEAISGTSEPVLPGFDRVDARLHVDERRLRALLVQQHGIWDQTQQLDRILNAWLLVAPPLPDPPVCDNGPCGNLLDATRTSGECSRCRSWRTRHGGMPWPKEPVTT